MQTISRKETVSQLLGVIAADQDRIDGLLREVAQVDYQPLKAALEPILAAKGKRLRPALLLLAAKMNHYDDVEQLIPSAAAIELLHTATLIHDDMIDAASTRRGVATVNSRLSDKAAVLVGDYLFAKAAHLAALSNSITVVQLFADVLMTIADGQLQEMFATTNPELLREEYYQLINAKTASLFGASAAMGATLGKSTPEITEAMRQFGTNFGMAFQIVDDILDYVGDERELGKPVGNDLRQGTITIPAIVCLQLYPDNNPLKSMLEGDTPSENDIRRIIEMARRSPALELCYAEATSFAERAKGALAHVPDNHFRQALIGLADYVVHRAS